MATHPLLSAWLLLCSSYIIACDARYVSLAPRADDLGTGGGLDAGPADVGLADLAGDQSGAEVVLARGELIGRSGYGASGSVSLVRSAAGLLELRFSEDFSASGVPGPVALLTTRAAVTGGVQPTLGDISLGPMSSVRGAQTYGAPEAGGAARYVFVYCLPFTVEVARATLEPVQ